MKFSFSLLQSAALRCTPGAFDVELYRSWLSQTEAKLPTSSGFDASFDIKRWTIGPLNRPDQTRPAPNFARAEEREHVLLGQIALIEGEQAAAQFRRRIELRPRYSHRRSQA